MHMNPEKLNLRKNQSNFLILFQKNRIRTISPIKINWESKITTNFMQNIDYVKLHHKNNENFLK